MDADDEDVQSLVDFLDDKTSQLGNGYDLLRPVLLWPRPTLASPT